MPDGIITLTPYSWRSSCVLIMKSSQLIRKIITIYFENRMNPWIHFFNLKLMVHIVTTIHQRVQTCTNILNKFFLTIPGSFGSPLYLYLSLFVLQQSSFLQLCYIHQYTILHFSVFFFYISSVTSLILCCILYHSYSTWSLTPLCTIFLIIYFLYSFAELGSSSFSWFHFFFFHIYHPVFSLFSVYILLLLKVIRSTVWSLHWSNIFNCG